MSYATVTDLKQRIPEDRFNAVYPDDASALVDIEIAEAEVNIHIQTRYQVPVTAVGLLPILKSWTLTLAEELLYSRNIQSDEYKKNQSRVENVRQSLLAVSEGRLRLAGATEAPSNAPTAVFVKGDEPIFTSDNLRGF